MSPIFESNILQWRTLNTSFQELASQQVYPPSQTLRCQEKCLKTPRATHQTLQASVSMLDVKAHDSTVRKGLNKYVMFGGFAGERTWQHSLGLQSYIWINHKASGMMSFGQMRPKWRCFLVIMHSTMHVENQTHSISAQLPHANCQAQWWSPDECLALSESTMDSSLYQSILKSNVRTSVQQLRLYRKRFMQQEERFCWISQGCCWWRMRNFFYSASVCGRILLFLDVVRTWRH